MIDKILMLSFLILIGKLCNGQQLIAKNGKYVIENDSIVKTVQVDYRYLEESQIQDLMNTNPESQQHYERYLIWRKRAKILGYGSLIGIAATTLKHINNQPYIVGGDSPDLRAYEVFIGYAASALVGTLALVVHVKERFKRDKAIDAYNRSQMDIIGYNKPAPSLHLGLTSNGLGLQYNF